jgi:hypothetical protein
VEVRGYLKGVTKVVANQLMEFFKASCLVVGTGALGVSLTVHRHHIGLVYNIFFI